MIDTREQPPPSPGPTLRGMERPVRSFKSFIKSAPPPSRSHNHKPLPPTPIYGRSIFDIPPPPVPLPSKQSATDTSWKAPAAWEDAGSPFNEVQAPFPLNLRSYAPLLPEPSPGVFEKLEPFPWSSGMATPPTPGLDRIRERLHKIPALPPRSPFRVSAFQPQTTESDPGTPTLSPDFYNPATPRFGTPSSCPNPIGSDMRASASQSDTDLRMSDLSTKEKAFASMHKEPPEEQDGMWDHWSGGPGTPRFRDNSRSPLPMYGRGHMPSNGESPLPEDDPDLDDEDERTQHLGVSQDYHDILADQYHKDHASTSTKSARILYNSESAMPPPTAIPRVPPNSVDMIPCPLSWKKEHGTSPSRDFTSSRRPDSNTRQRRISSWAPVQQMAHALRRPSLDERYTRSSIDPALPSPTQDYDVQRRSSGKEHRVSDLILNLRAMSSSTKAAKGPETYHPTGTNQPTVVSTRHALNSPKFSPHPQSGYGINQQLTIPTPRHQITSFLNLSPASTLDTPRAFPTTDSLGIDDSPNDWRRSSVYSRYTHASVAPAVAIKQGMRTSSGSMSSYRSHSNASSPPTSPLAHQISFPRTPPLVPAYAPRVLTSPADQSPASYKSNQSSLSRAESESDEEFPKRSVPLGFLDKAKGARKAWRRRQKDVKHEKLKASIRVIGPTDSTVDSVNVMQGGRALVDAGAQNLIPRHIGMAGGAF